MKPKGVTIQTKALDEYIVMVLLVLEPEETSFSSNIQNPSSPKEGTGLISNYFAWWCTLLSYITV